MSTASDTPVDDYLASLDGPRAERIAALYAAVRAIVPDAGQAMKYAMPALVLDGSGIWSVQSTRKHIGIYPYSGHTVQAHADELGALGIPTTRGAIQLPDAVDLPAELLEAIVRTRLAELGR